MNTNPVLKTFLNAQFEQYWYDWLSGPFYGM